MPYKNPDDKRKQRREYALKFPWKIKQWRLKYKLKKNPNLVSELIEREKERKAKLLHFQYLQNLKEHESDMRLVPQIIKRLRGQIMLRDKLKQCVQCGEIKGYDYFYVREGSRRSRCISCTRKKENARKREYNAIRRARTLEWRLNNPRPAKQSKEQKSRIYNQLKLKRNLFRRTHFFMHKARTVIRLGKAALIPKELRPIKLSILERQLAKDLWRMWKNQRGLCALTGEKLDSFAQVDHIIPKARGGDDTLRNLRWVTSRANLLKRDLLDAELLALCKAVTLRIDQAKNWKLIAV